MRPETASYVKLVEKDDDVMTIEDYLKSVEVGGFIDYDGMGLPIKDGKAADLGFLTYIYPSQGIGVIPLDATHIVWYNR